MPGKNPSREKDLSLICSYSCLSEHVLNAFDETPKDFEFPMHVFVTSIPGRLAPDFLPSYYRRDVPTSKQFVDIFSDCLLF